MDVKAGPYRKAHRHSCRNDPQPNCAAVMVMAVSSHSDGHDG
jgi:hypothetical protein